MRRPTALLASAVLALLAFVPLARAEGFGIAPGSFTAGSFQGNGSGALNEGATPDTRAGAHPFGASTAFALNTITGPPPNNYTLPDGGDTKDVVVKLPPGFVGDPNATPQCRQATLIQFASCPNDTVVGVVHLNLSFTAFEGFPAVWFVPVYNMVPSAGQPALFAFYNPNPALVVFIHVHLRPADNYAVTATVSDAAVAATPVASALTLWGVPADSSHDPYRGGNYPQGAKSEFGCLDVATGASLGSCPSDAPPRPFLTNPAACEGEPLTTLAVDSWQEPGVTLPDGSPNLSDPAWKTATATSPEPTGCDEVPFNPSISVAPDNTQAGAPTGLSVDLSLPQSEDPNGLSTSPLKKAVVTLPEGMTMSPAAADGLQGCTPSQIGIGTEKPVECPEASKLGTVRVESPDLPEQPDGSEGALTGSAYLGKPEGSLNTGPPYTLYLDVSGFGVDVKLKGSVEPNEQTGQITTTFADNPQLPFDHLTLHVKGGPQAPLVNPPDCGPNVTTTSLTPWSAPNQPRHPTATFTTTGACAATPPFSPAVEAGTEDPTAAMTSPFRLRLSRPDGDQPLSAIDVTTPPGLSAYLKGVPYCPESAIAAAQRNSGTAEAAAPSCPIASQVGVVNTGAGAGPNPFYVSGKAYLAGPYKGAPLSMVFVTPALAGPFDLGDVVVRAGLYVNPETAQITVRSDPLPQILGGVPLQLRSVAVNVDRPHFTLNPTNCNPLAVNTEAISLFGAQANITDRFQVGGCKALDFKPKLYTRLFGKTHRGAHPRFRAVLKMKGGEANIARAAVTLPHSEFLDQSHIKTICTRVQFAEGQVPGEKCPAGSIYGHARAITPLLDQPLEGPVYLRSSSNKLPDLVAALNGQIQIALDGRIDSIHGGIRNSFEVVPDAPVSKFMLEMQGGAKGLLVNSTDICKGTHRVTAKFTGQNGATHDIEPLLKDSACGRHRR